jgi:hypothetical protein
MSKDDILTTQRAGGIESKPQAGNVPAGPHVVFPSRMVDTVSARSITDDTISVDALSHDAAPDEIVPETGDESSRTTVRRSDAGRSDAGRSDAGRSDAERSAAGHGEVKLTFLERVEAFISRLSTKNTFWHRVCSFIWLPYAFKSGIALKRIDENEFVAVLPFRRMNRNWYNAMAGAALLGNSEIAGGMYVFGACGGDYTVVCKNLQYKFQRPCIGAAIYHITPREDIQPLLKAGTEFNITLDLVIAQQPRRAEEKEKRVGRCEVTFHVTPKSQWRARKARAAAAAAASQ